MSRPQQHSGYREVIYIGPPPPRPSNWLGVLGFLTTFLSCGALSPLGLLLSLIALPKRPRSFAFAGTVIGGIGTAVLATVSWSGYQEMQAHANHSMARVTHMRLREASQILRQEVKEEGAVPEGVQGNKAIVEILDGWKNSLRYDLYPEEQFYLIRSAGPDGQYETDDDLYLRTEYAGNAEKPQMVTMPSRY